MQDYVRIGNVMIGGYEGKHLILMSEKGRHIETILDDRDVLELYLTLTHSMIEAVRHLKEKVKLSIASVKYDADREYKNFEVESEMFGHPMMVNTEDEEKAIRMVEESIRQLKVQVDTINTYEARLEALRGLLAFLDNLEGKVVEMARLSAEYRRLTEDQSLLGALA